MDGSCYGHLEVMTYLIKIGGLETIWTKGAHWIMLKASVRPSFSFFRKENERVQLRFDGILY
jgi:hypothetical protein